MLISLGNYGKGLMWVWLEKNAYYFSVYLLLLKWELYSLILKL